ncbi:hypothetical protein Tco_1354983 [Tanacetum coccineum]
MTRKLDDMIEFPKSQPKRTYNEDLECEIVMVKMPKCMAWLDDEPIGDLDTIEDKVDNSSPQCTLQVLLLIELYTPPVTHQEKVEETIRIPMEVEPLDHMKLDDLGLNTNTHGLFLSSKGFPSVDEPEPQLLPNFSPLDVNLGDKRGTNPPINPYSPGLEYRMNNAWPSTFVVEASNQAISRARRDNLILALKSMIGPLNLRRLDQLYYGPRGEAIGLNAGDMTQDPLDGQPHIYSQFAPSSEQQTFSGIPHALPIQKMDPKNNNTREILEI